MGKVYLSQFKFNEYKGAENINVRFGYTPETPYLEDYSVVDSNGFYLSQDEPNEFNYTLSTEYAGDTTVYLNRNMSGICKDLTNLYHTDLMNKTKLNYHYTTNLHTAFANCYRLFEQPISAKYVNSMYGTYYNGTNLYGPAAVNANVTNMIGTYYNCNNITAGNTSVKTTVMIDAFHDCGNIVGRPYCGNNVKSLYNAYYNCFNLRGAPANCNNAAITINAYYNCPNLNGTFYWYKKDTPFADAINATNMFYNRNCSSWLNIYVYPNKCIFNALVNYSDTFGNIYGTGALTWSKVSGLHGFNNYENALYKTRIVEHFSPIYLSSYIFNNTITTSSYTSQYYYRYNCNMNIFNGIYNCIEDLPKDEEFDSSGTLVYLNSTYGIRIYYRHCLKYSRLHYSYQDTYTYYNFHRNTLYLILNNQDPDLLCWSSAPGMRTVNDLDYVRFLNLDAYVTNLNYIYDAFSFTNNQIVIAKCGDKVTDMYYTYYVNLDGYAYPYENGKEMPYWLWDNLNNASSVFYHSLPDYYNTRSINVPTNISIRPACSDSVINMYCTYQNWNLDTQPVCGNNVRTMHYTYQNCRGIVNPACGDNVQYFIGTYYNTDLKNPKFGTSVINSYRAYGYTAVTSENIILPNTITNVSYTYRNCVSIKNIENLNFQGISNFAGCFLGCTGLLINNDTNLNLGTTITTLSHSFFSCEKIQHILPFPSDMYYIKNMTNAYYWCTNLRNLGEKHFTSDNFKGTFASCINLETGADKIYFTNSTTDLNYIFHHCSSLADNIDWDLPLNHQSHLGGCFCGCNNIEYINIHQSEYGCFIDSGFCSSCGNLNIINFYPPLGEDQEIYVNYDYLFYYCNNLNYIYGVKNFNGYYCNPPTSPGDTSATINREQDITTNNSFSISGGQGGRIFYMCPNLKYIPNFVGGGYFGPSSFYNCSNITHLNFWAGDHLSWTTYVFLGAETIQYCSNLTTITFDKVRNLNYNRVNYAFVHGCHNLTNIFIQNYYDTTINITYNTMLAADCENLTYLYTVRPINYNYEYSENNFESYQDLYPIKFYMNNVVSFSTWMDLNLVNGCTNMIDYCDCPYLMNIRFYTTSNSKLLTYGNNLRGLIINSNYMDHSVFDAHLNLSNLNYLSVFIDESMGYTNWSYSITQAYSPFIYFNIDTNTNTVLDTFSLRYYNRWTGTYYNYTENYYAKNNKRVSYNYFSCPNIFTNTNYTYINKFFLDDRIEESTFTKANSQYEGHLVYLQTIAARNHFLNYLFNNGLRQITNINMFILQSGYMESHSGNSFILKNIVNSRKASTYRYNTPYTLSNSNFVPLSKIHCNSIYICPKMFLGSTYDNSNYVSNFITPGIYTSYNFKNIITNDASIQNVSLFFGVDFYHYNMLELNVPEFTHQIKYLTLNPSMVKISYDSQSYSYYSKGTYGEHIAYIGYVDDYIKYFGDMTFTKSETLIASYTDNHNIYQYNIQKLNTLRTNDLVNQFIFYPSDSVDYNCLFRGIKGWTNEQTIRNLNNKKNILINLYEVDICNSSRNIHIKYILEELNFLD